MSGTEERRRGTKSQRVPNVATILGVVTRGIGMLPVVVVQLSADGALSARSPACIFGDDEPSVCCGDGPTIFVAVCKVLWAVPQCKSVQKEVWDFPRRSFV